MEKIVHCVLLVDDNMDDNFLHTRTIEKSGKVNLIKVASDGVEALSYLNNEGKFQNKEENPRPHIIFLDLHMPKMDGFEFLEVYKNYNINRKADICIAMLPHAENPDELKKAEAFEVIQGYCKKPIDERAIENAINKMVLG